MPPEIAAALILATANILVAMIANRRRPERPPVWSERPERSDRAG
jgi:hypothetical protein